MIKGNFSFKQFCVVKLQEEEEELAQLQMVNHFQDLSSEAPTTGMFRHINTE